MIKYYIQDNKVKLAKYETIYEYTKKSYNSENNIKASVLLENKRALDEQIEKLKNINAKYTIIEYDTSLYEHFNGLSVKSVEEAENIINPNIETLRKNKIDEMKQACKDYIYNGIDVELINGETKHFSLTLEDQMNLNGLVTQISIGNIKAEKGVPYHADGEMCTLFSIGDFTMIANKASEHVIKQTTYCNHLMNYIKSLDTRENIESVYYGMELVGEFLDNYKGLTEHEEDN